MTEAKREFSRYEKARIIGARALQIAMNAPLLIKIKEEDLERIKYDALKMAEIELESGALPITVNEPIPSKAEEDLEKEETKEVKDEELKEKAEKEEKEIAEEGEIMEIANPQEESDSGEKQE